MRWFSISVWTGKLRITITHQVVFIYSSVLLYFGEKKTTTINYSAIFIIPCPLHKASKNHKGRPDLNELLTLNSYLLLNIPYLQGKKVTAILFIMLRIKPKVSYVLGIHSTSELHPQSLIADLNTHIHTDNWSFQSNLHLKTASIFKY